MSLICYGTSPYCGQFLDTAHAGRQGGDHAISRKPASSSAKLGQTRSNPVADEAEVGIAMSEPWLSADDISAHLGVTKDTVYAWIADKAMPAHKVGRLWKFQASEIDEWVRSGGAAASEEPTTG